MDEGKKRFVWNWSVLVSVLILNTFLHSIILCYGTFWVHGIGEDYHNWNVISTPTVYVLLFSISHCWCREAADSWGGHYGYRVMAAVGLLLVVSGFIIFAYTPAHMIVYFYGILGGLGSSIIFAQIDAVIFEIYEDHLLILKGISLAGQAIGLSICPHLITVIINKYEYKPAFLVFSGVILQMMPLIMFIKVNLSRSTYYKSYDNFASVYSIIQDDILNRPDNDFDHLSNKNWKSLSNTNQSNEDDDDSDDSLTNLPQSSEIRSKNIYGVEILPEIIEESEYSDESELDDCINTNHKYSREKRISIAIKRLSIIGDNLDDYILKQTRRDSINEDTYQSIVSVTTVGTKRFSIGLGSQSINKKVKRKIFLTSHRRYKIKRRFDHIFNKIYDIFFEPLKTTLLFWRFYPVILLNLSRLSLYTIVLPSLSAIALNMRPKIPISEINFLMTLCGFTWLSFLLCTPWIINTSKNNFKFICTIGLITSSIACYVLSSATDHDTLSIGCVIAGIGLGALNISWETTAQYFVGLRVWPKIVSPLEILTSIGLVLVAFIFTYFYKYDLQYYILILDCFITVTTFIWLLICVVSFFMKKQCNCLSGNRCLI